MKNPGERSRVGAAPFPEPVWPIDGKSRVKLKRAIGQIMQAEATNQKMEVRPGSFFYQLVLSPPTVRVPPDWKSRKKPRAHTKFGELVEESGRSEGVWRMTGHLHGEGTKGYTDGLLP